jgi:hypothetical protein
MIMAQVSREVAWRVFAGEYNESTCEVAGEGDRAPSYIITPLGASVNRIFVVGVITEVDNIGTDSEPMWRARLSDPTGVFYLSAGQYQPEAAQVLSRLEPPAIVAVVGKSRVYSPEAGATFVSIRPELIKEVGEDIRNYWIVDTCKAMKTRLDAVSEALRMESPTVEELTALGFSKRLAEGVVKALEHYGEVDPNKFLAMLKDALRYLVREEWRGVSVMSSPRPEDTRSVEVAEMPGVTEESEKLIINIIRALDQNGLGALMDNIVQKAGEKGLDSNSVEEVINSLLDKGVIYEPVLGRIKSIEG